MSALGSMHDYYSDRAQYMAKNVEDDPSAQVQAIVAEVRAQSRDRAVLEVACGTGNWTRLAASAARSVTATDYSAAMLAVARGRGIPRTRFVQADACDLGGIGGERHDFGLAMWLVSHLGRAQWPGFFASFHARLQPGATVLLVDDIRRPDDLDPWYSKPATRDAYEIRRLPNGKSYEIVKFFFTPEELRALLEPYARNLRLRYESPPLVGDVRGPCAGSA